MCKIEIRVHLDHLPAAITILIDSYEEARVILLPPLNVKVCCLWVAWNHIPIKIHTIQILSIKKIIIFSWMVTLYRKRVRVWVQSCVYEKKPNKKKSIRDPYFFLSSGSAGMALWRGASSSSWEITSLAFTWTPEILNVGPFTFPLLPPDDQVKITKLNTSLASF